MAAPRVNEVACEDEADAEWLRDLLIERGIPRTALKVIKQGAA